MVLPEELIKYILEYINIKNDNNVNDILDNLKRCSICNNLFYNPKLRWYCSHECERQLLLML